MPITDIAVSTLRANMKLETVLVLAVFSSMVSALLKLLRLPRVNTPVLAVD